MKDVMSEDLKTLLKTIDWLKRVEIIYRAVVHIVEEMRKHDITTTDYVSLLNAHYRTAVKMLDFLFSAEAMPVDDVFEYKIELDNTLSKYLTDDKHWKQTQINLNETLMEIVGVIADFNIPVSKAIEDNYIQRLVAPVNTLLAKYHKEHIKSDDVVYRLTYDAMNSDLYLNDKKIYHAKIGGADLVFNTLFDQTGPLKQSSEFFDDNNKKKIINAVSTINNIKKMPRSLRNYMMSSYNDGNGIKIITEVKRTDIDKQNINSAEVDRFLEA